MTCSIRFPPTLLLLTCFSLSAHAGVPSPPNSTFPPCLVTCPLGDLYVEVIVRDIANNPLTGASVTFVFSDCPDAFLCPPMPGDPYQIVHVIQQTANSVAKPAKA